MVCAVLLWLIVGLLGVINIGTLCVFLIRLLCSIVSGGLWHDCWFIVV